MMISNKTNPVLSVKNVSKQYKDHIVLDNISFDLNHNEIIFITGHSGAGKSTLLKLITMLTKPSSGEIIFDEHNIVNISKYQIPMHRRKMGIIFQDPMLINDLDVFNNIALPLVIAGFSYKDITRRVNAALEKVSLVGKERHLPDQLSSGEQQRVSIARAIVNKPKIIIADEPTGNLDPKLSGEIFNLFQDLSLVGVSMLITTHDTYLIDKFPQRRIILNKGKSA